MFAHRQQKPARRGFLSPGGPVLCHSTCFPTPSLPRLEGSHGAFLGRLLLWFDFRLGDALVNLYRCSLPHLVSDMGVSVQRGGAGHMAQDSGQCFNIHSVGQSIGGECVSQIVEPGSLTPGVIQYAVQPMVDRGRAHGGVFFLG